MNANVPQPQNRRNMIMRFRIPFQSLNPQTDLRLQFLMIIRRRALLLETIYCATFTGLAIGAYFRDFNQSCKPDIKLWLSVMVARTLLRMIVRLFMACAANNIALIGNSFGTAKKIVEMLDVFGMVWFAVGNLLVFNGINCARTIPMTFYVSIAYIGTAYFTLVAPVVVRFSLAVIPSRNGMREIPGEGDGPPGEAMGMGAGRHGHGNGNGLSSAVTAPQAAYWKDWLERYGCVEHVYCKETLRQGQGQGQQGQGQGQGQGAEIEDTDTTGEVRASGSDGDYGKLRGAEAASVPNDGLYDPVGMDICPICLGDFNSTEVEMEVEAGAATADGVATATGPAANPTPPTVPNANSNESQLEEGRVQGLGQGQREREREREEPPTPRVLIVQFPCLGRHLFHVECLHSWLSVASSRTATGRNANANNNVNAGVTCPCCRESPAMPATVTASASVSAAATSGARAGTGAGAGAGTGTGTATGAHTNTNNANNTYTAAGTNRTARYFAPPPPATTTVTVTMTAAATMPRSEQPMQPQQPQQPHSQSYPVSQHEQVPMPQSQLQQEPEASSSGTRVEPFDDNDHDIDIDYINDVESGNEIRVRVGTGSGSRNSGVSTNTPRITTTTDAVEDEEAEASPTSTSTPATGAVARINPYLHTYAIRDRSWGGGVSS